MRSTPLRRKTHLKSRGIIKKRQRPIRKVSKGKAAKDRKIDPEKRRRKAEFGCMKPGCNRTDVDTHEIVGAPYKHITAYELCCQLCLCREHHDECERGEHSHAAQLSWKKMSGDESYCLAEFNRLTGKAITARQVQRFITRRAA